MPPRSSSFQSSSISIVTGTSCRAIEIGLVTDTVIDFSAAIVATAVIMVNTNNKNAFFIAMVSVL